MGGIALTSEVSVDRSAGVEDRDAVAIELLRRPPEAGVDDAVEPDGRHPFPRVDLVDPGECDPWLIVVQPIRRREVPINPLYVEPLCKRPSLTNSRLQHTKVPIRDKHGGCPVFFANFVTILEHEGDCVWVLIGQRAESPEICLTEVAKSDDPNGGR